MDSEYRRAGQEGLLHGHQLAADSYDQSRHSDLTHLQAQHRSAFRSSLQNPPLGGMLFQSYELSSLQPAPQMSSDAARMHNMERQLFELQRIMKLDHRIDEHDDELQHIKDTFQNDLRYLEQRLERVEVQQPNQTPALLKHSGQYLPPEKPPSECPPNHTFEKTNDEVKDHEKIAGKPHGATKAIHPGRVEVIAPAVRNLPSGHLICETDDAVVEVILEHIENFQANPERVDSKRGSPVRPVGTSAGHACCDVQFSNEEDLIKHVQGVHMKPKDVEIAADPHAEHEDPPDPVPISTRWCPFAIRNLPLPTISTAAGSHGEMFSWTFLTDLFGGQEWCSGYYFNSDKSCMLPSQGYWLVELEHEPFMPRAPGQHGAKVTTFFNDTPVSQGRAPKLKNYKDTPVFVSADRGRNYRYLGQYSQLRYSDKIGYDTLMEHIPESVRRYHVEQLARVGRPPWVTWCMRTHFWPKPEYKGPMPTDSACHTPQSAATAQGSSGGLDRHVKTAFDQYALELQEWEQDSAMRVNNLYGEDGVRALLDAYNMEDMQQGLRLWWEYQQCIGYDDEFYEMLVKFKKHPVPTVSRFFAGASIPTGRLAQLKQKSLETDQLLHAPTPPKSTQKSTDIVQMMNQAMRKAAAAATSVHPKPAKTDLLQVGSDILPPHLRKQQQSGAAAAVTPIPSATAHPPTKQDSDELNPAKTPNPFLHVGMGDLDEARSFAKDATSSKDAAGVRSRKDKIAPHLRGK